MLKELQDIFAEAARTRIWGTVEINFQNGVRVKLKQTISKKLEVETTPMPKLPTAKRLKQVYACPPDKCNAKRHMPATTVMKVWDVMTGFAAYWQKNNDGRLIFSASVRPTLANAVPCEPQTADEAIAWLLANDWLVLEEKSRRRRDNTLGPNTYRLRTHDEYVKVHPGNCPPYPCRPNFEAEPIKVPARKMSLAERDQWLKFSPQAAP